jgi:hypothetical protein
LDGRHQDRHQDERHPLGAGNLVEIRHLGHPKSVIPTWEDAHLEGLEEVG